MTTSLFTVPSTTQIHGSCRTCPRHCKQRVALRVSCPAEEALLGLLPPLLFVSGYVERVRDFPIFPIFSLGAGISYDLTGHWLATPLLVPSLHSMELKSLYATKLSFFPTSSVDQVGSREKQRQLSQLLIRWIVVHISSARGQSVPVSCIMMTLIEILLTWLDFLSVSVQISIFNSDHHIHFPSSHYPSNHASSKKRRSISFSKEAVHGSKKLQLSSWTY